MKHIARALASKGRGPDTTLVHMSVPEVQALDKIARSHGLGSLTTNPHTGLPEAGLLSTLLPLGAMMIPGMQPMAMAALAGGAGMLGSALEGGTPNDMLRSTVLGGIGGYGAGSMGLGQGAAKQAVDAGAMSGMPMTQGAQAAVDATTQGLGIAQPTAANMAPAYNPTGTGIGLDAQIPMTPKPEFAMANNASGASQYAQGASPATWSPAHPAAPTNPTAAAPAGIPGATPPINPSAAKPEQGFWSKLGDFTANHPDKMIPLALGGIRMLNGKKQQPLQQQARPTYQTATASTSPTAFNTYRTQRGFAQGGVTSLISGPGDGMSDSIPAYIQGGAPHVKEPIKVTDGEYIVSADVVSGLGNGSTEAGARKLDQMMAKVRDGRTGKKKQAPAINANKYLPA